VEDRAASSGDTAVGFLSLPEPHVSFMEKTDSESCLSFHIIYQLEIIIRSFAEATGCNNDI
jgi:hypothetical protein